MVNINCFYGDNCVTRIDLTNTCSTESPPEEITTLRFYIDDCVPTSCAPVRYTSNGSYQELREKIKKYLKHKKLSKIRMGWNNPRTMEPIYDIKPKQPAFKNHAMNSKRGN